MKPFSLKAKTKTCCKGKRLEVSPIVYRPIKVKFRHKGGAGGSCDNGSDCGICPGICVSIPIGNYDYRIGLGNDSFIDGWGIAFVAQMNQKLHFVPLANIDNGDGKVIISQEFGLNLGERVIIRRGTYPLIKRHEFPFGYLELDIM